jgi:hypothetical protein
MLTIIWAALLGSLLAYGFIVFQISNGQQPKDLDPVFVYALGGVAVGTMVIIPFLRSKLLPPMKEASSLNETVPEDPQVAKAVARVYSASIVSWAMSESIAIYGLLLAFLSFQPKFFFVFAGGSVANFVIYRPRKELLLGAARAAG